MRKFFFSMVVAMMAITASAQTYIGGELGFWRNWQKGQNSTTLNILPEVGYNLDDNWAIGTTIGYIYEYNKGEKINCFKVAPYARYTFLKLDNVKLFLDGGFGFGTYKYAEGDDDAHNSWEIGLKPGVSVSLTDKLGFIAHMGFLGYRTSDDSKGMFGDNGLGFNLSNSLTFGLYWNF